MTLAYILTVIVALVSLLMLPAFAAAAYFGESSMFAAFLVPVSAGILAGGAALALRRNKTALKFRRKDGYLLVFLAWVCATLLGSLCYYFAPNDMGWVDAVFESACSFSTTGATTVASVEILPKSLLLWRGISQWAGGMGIILLSVALLPLLGVGGIQLVKAEVTGPEKDKVRPRIAETAKVLWGVYCVFTIALVLLYRIGGMTWFDAACHGLAVITTGGIGTHDSGFAHFDSAFIDWVTIVFMLLGAINFSMYYRLVRGKRRDLFYNTETRVFLLIFAVAAIVISATLIPVYGGIGEALRMGTFQTASFLTTTGSHRADYNAWPPFAQAVLFLLIMAGGCSGSTSGGIKVIRHVILFKQAGSELRRAIYPAGVFSIHLNGKVGRKDVVYGVAGFVFLYFMIVGISTLVTAASGLNLFASFSVALSMTGNLGATFDVGGAPNTYSDFPDYLKLYYSVIMIAGRLELWTVAVLFNKGFWKR